MEECVRGIVKCWLFYRPSLFGEFGLIGVLHVMLFSVL